MGRKICRVPMICNNATSYEQALQRWDDGLRRRTSPAPWALRSGFADLTGPHGLSRIKEPARAAGIFHRQKDIHARRFASGQTRQLPPIAIANRSCSCLAHCMLESVDGSGSPIIEALELLPVPMNHSVIREVCRAGRNCGCSRRYIL